MENFEKTSRDFWAKQIKYPGYDYIKDRRLYELLYTLDKIKKYNPDKIVDLGCGTGSTVTLLRELCYVNEYYCYDVSDSMLSTIDKNTDRDSIVKTGVIDFTKKDYVLPDNLDLCICYGLLQYINDESVTNLLSKLNSKHILFRNACEPEKRNTINTYSEKLNSDYGCTYRTVEEYLEFFKKSGLRVINYERCYPDDIESAYGTKQYFFECENEKSN
jgi:trans-aconitate methyltransferase